MHKRLKILINNVKEIFSIEFLDKLSKKTGFIKRKSKITAETFLAFNTFSSEDLCDKSLSTLCGIYSEYNVLLSAQALNERFNEYSVAFMQEAFNHMMMKQNEVKRNRGKINDKSEAWTERNSYFKIIKKDNKFNSKIWSKIKEKKAIKW